METREWWWGWGGIGSGPKSWFKRYQVNIRGLDQCFKFWVDDCVESETVQVMVWEPRFQQLILRTPSKWLSSAQLSTEQVAKCINASHWRGPQSSVAVWKSRWPSWAPVPNKRTVPVDVKKHFSEVPTSLTLFFWRWLVISSVFLGRSVGTSYS